MRSKNHQYWMTKAIQQAKLAGNPFGAVIVNSDQEFVEAFNTSKQDGPTAHAEINVIQKMKELYYEDPKKLTLYSTVEPCPMCMSAVIWAGIGKVVYGASIEDASLHGRQIDISCQEIAQKSWYTIALESGIERLKCVQLFDK